MPGFASIRGDEFNRTDDVAIEFVEVAYRDPVRGVRSVANLMHFVSRKELSVDPEAGDEADISGSGILSIPAAGYLGCVLKVSHWIEERLALQVRREARVLVRNNQLRFSLANRPEQLGGSCSRKGPGSERPRSSAAPFEQDLSDNLMRWLRWHARLLNNARNDRAEAHDIPSDIALPVPRSGQRVGSEALPVLLN